MDILQARKIMGKNFIGPEELKKIASQLKIPDPYKVRGLIPKIPFDLNYLKRIYKDYILILGMPKAKDGEKLTINKLRLLFGWNPKKSEPCFYNQDWYLKEKFASKTHLNFRWYLIRKNIIRGTRGKDPMTIEKNFKTKQKFPPAVLTAFAFFAYYFHSKGKRLWQYDFIWCADKDRNGDRIYTGCYIDPKKINKNGFNIHRHLSIRSCYGSVPQIL